MTQTARQFQRNCDTATDDKDHRAWIRIALNQAAIDAVHTNFR